MTTLAERPEIVGGVISHADGLEITTDLPFNEWKRLGERLLETTDRAFWSLGDWWLYGERYAKDYHDAMQALESSSRFVSGAARVSRAFDRGRRRGQLAFEFHEVVAGLSEPEQDRWLDDAERQGWDRRQLQFAYVESMPRMSVQALSVRLVDDHYRLAIAAAERRDMDPKEWVLEAIREKVNREAPELESASPDEPGSEEAA